MRLLVTRRLPPANMAFAAERFDTVFRDGDRGLTPEEAGAALREYDAILPTLGDRFAASAFDGGPFRCRILANFGVGVNHIDVAAAKAAGLVVANTPGAVTDATADIAMALILMTARRLGEGERMLRAGRWTGWEPTQMLGTHVTGLTVGIVGMGRIGQAVARRCHFGFGMEVAYFNRSPKAVEVPARQVGSLDELMRLADVVVVAVPGGAETRGLIGVAELAAMRPTGFLVNVARGDVVVEDALVAALEAGRIAGAGLDVYAREPEVPARLRALENVVLLPHLGTATLRVREAMGRMALDNLVAFAEGRAVPNPV
ncbi:D-3-phosphoglycerate dehydrogenase [Rubellimicrobium mesophilum DSM 19309]|uniref:D-3-phosphoglycerate dehydrogenase n=1 Tax=Rubellimicrobium mesophilum DSM 19309 TaxID=442562 RepID=A0A017HTZ6_9RHOB|nr:D-glycerate dehydrogenase [Rubellimicrobium mesophilum]EYD77603.1 D-3-phosphoglycerate dehydrogenase [Rubellimicrobium mesophilum DSM 19309]